MNCTFILSHIISPKFVSPYIHFTPRSFHVHFTPRSFHPTFISPHIISRTEFGNYIAYDMQFSIFLTFLKFFFKIETTIC